jgi:MFS family permease
MSLIDKLGRKTLLLIGSVGTAVCLSGVAAVFFTETHPGALVWLLVAYIAFFAVSQGAVIWVYISEVFPTRVRAKGQSLGSSSHWIMNALVSLAFPILAKGQPIAPSSHRLLNGVLHVVNPLLAKTSPGVPFIFFAAMMVLQFFVVMFLYPETKNVTLEQLQHKLGIK